MKKQDPSQLSVPLGFLTVSDTSTGASHSFDTSAAIFNDAGKFGGISGLQLKDLMLFNLIRLQSNTAMKEALRAEAAEAYPILSQVLTKIWVEYKSDGKTIERFGIDIVDPATIRFGSVASEDKERALELGPLVGQMLDGKIPRDEALIEEYNQIDQQTLEPENEEAHKQAVWNMASMYMNTSAVYFALMVSIYPKKELVKIFKKPKASNSRKPRDQKVDAGFYIKGGHLVDQALSHQYPDTSASSLTLFNSLTPNIQESIESEGVSTDTLVEGIKLTAMEQRIVDALCKLLHNKSPQTSDPAAEGYYSGNHPSELKRYGATGERLLAPQLMFSLYELTREVNGNMAISGGHEHNVYTALNELAGKRFVMRYTATVKMGKGRKEKYVERFEPLIKIIKAGEAQYDEFNKKTSEVKMTLIELDPIFIHQIDSKFVKTPSDIARRTIIAAGNTTNIPAATLLLRDYLIRQHGTLVARKSKTFTHEIGVELLQHKLCEEYLKGPIKKKQRAKQYTERAIQVAKQLGLIEGFEIKPSATGSPKYVFSLNKEWK